MKPDNNNRVVEVSTLILVFLVVVTRDEQHRMPDGVWFGILLAANFLAGVTLSRLVRRFIRLDNELGEAAMEVSRVVAGEVPTYSECLHRAAMRKRRQDIVYSSLGIWGRLGVVWTFATCFGLFVFLADVTTCSLQVAIVAFLALKWVCHASAQRMVSLLDATQNMDAQVIAAIEGE